MKKTLLPLFILLILGLTFTPGSAQLVINEIDYDQPGNDSAEFIELYNPSTTGVINLADYMILLFNGSATVLAVYDSVALPSYSISPGGYFVVCDSGSTVSNCNFSLDTTDNGIQNGGAYPDAVALLYIPTMTIVDAVSYEGNCPFPYLEGTGVPLNNSDNNDSTDMSISRLPNGSDSNDNAADFSFVCSTPGATNCVPTQTIQINKMKTVLHVYPNPASTTLSFFGVADPSLNYDVTIYDMLGKLCFSANMPAAGYGVFRVDLSSLTETGLYSIVISNENISYSERSNFIVVK